MSFSLKKTLLLTALGCIPFTAALAQNGEFVAQQIKVEGLQRVSEKTVLKELEISPGELIDAAETNQAIQSLYASGRFSNVRMYKYGQALIVKVQERPAIAQINIKGNSTIKTKDIQKVLEQVGLSTGSVIDPSVVFQVKQSLLLQYATMSYYSTEVSIKERPLSRNRVAIDIHIAEGRKAEVRRVQVLGTKAYSESDAADSLSLETPSIWNFWGLFSSKTEYSPHNMDASLKGLDNLYVNHGFLDFRVASEQASLSPDKENAYIAFNVDEGKRYRISGISFDGRRELADDELKRLVNIRKGDVFSRQKIIDGVKAIEHALGDKGYAFANVNPLPKVDKEKGTIAITFFVEPGKKVYIRHVNFAGNTVTNDNVYRRVVQYYESGLYNQALINQSKIKLQRMPFVESVKVTKTRVPGTDDMIDMNYNIKERSANKLSGSVSYSQLYNFVVSANLDLPNILGSGDQFSIGVNLSKVTQGLNLSYTDPFFTQSGISQTFSLNTSNTNYNSTSIADYQVNQYGANLGYGIPLSTFSALSVGAGLKHTSLEAGSDSRIFSRFKAMNGNDTSFDELTFNAGWNYDSSNRAFFPTEGRVLSVHAYGAAPISELEWYKLTASARYYHPVTDNVTLSLQTGAGYGDGYGKTSELPFFKNFYSGGWGSVRGYAQGSLGPADTTGMDKGNSIGGNLNLYTNLDLLFPVPGVKNSKNMRLGVFFDAGNVYDTYNIPEFNPATNPAGTIYYQPASPRTPNLSNLRYSTGVEFQWLSPIGPMAFSLAKDLNSEAGDDTRVFQFTLGHTF